MYNVPEKFKNIANGRLKPFGTAHAVLAARHIVNDNFAVINADDFYGRDAFKKLSEHLSCTKNSNKVDSCMIGYVLKNTLTENGSVSRGICNVDKFGKLIDITEKTKIFATENGAEYEENEIKIPISVDSVVSMNCWGFTPNVFKYIEKGFETFLSKLPDKNSEYYLPLSVKEMIDNKVAEVDVYKTNAKWYGVTYKEDKPAVMAGIKKQIDDGFYPSPLWK